jgi:undecaprenyl-diphosphatase
MSVPPATRRTLAPIVIVTASALLFVLLLLLVRVRWAPLESADHELAIRLNSLVAGHPVTVSIVKAVTWLGSGGVLWTLIGAPPSCSPCVGGGASRPTS